ncbi:hypothetical protein SELMODRAFT_271018 [Selaginella moellendorffii]|uniref:S1 motif domain-containing protein n=1 Tax=Selaginella moellendorffii TaxID=88036 RepID=D8RQA0_SELML|nr:30S ribosomal protein S1, chloroplastic [Selaginella moellendorffii]EFJ25818.1 hypothetical protein SELMODRAFT_271018 [Selaginella moellendorffii]|eukprot:XP_024533999.1 30S ribosomal protein S1, chloroplastic [Selaginella moellendorffii]
MGAAAVATTTTQLGGGIGIGKPLVVGSSSSSSFAGRRGFLGSNRKAAGGFPGGGKNAARVHCVVAFADPRSRNLDIKEEIERRWEALQENPLEGVPFTVEEFEEALSKYEFDHSVGDVVKGTVFVTDKLGALVDIGGKSMAFLPMDLASVFKLKDLRVMGLFSGVQEQFEVVREDEENSRFIVSLREMHIKLSWERLKQIQAEDAICKGVVVSSNRGGLSLQIECLKAFLPFSQLAGGLNQENLTGRELPVKVLEVDEEQKRLVVSHRKALAENQATLGIGSVVVGTVQTIKPYGAFIDLGGLTGLLHVSQISHDRITTVENVLSPGDKLKVMVLSHDKDRGRISLSTKKLEPTPGDMLRNPSLVYEKADEMAMTFRQRVAQAEAAARAEDLQFQQGAGRFGLSADILGVEEDLPAAAEPAPEEAAADILSTPL